MLELLDVTGRRVALQNVGALGAGRHALTLSTGRAWPPGVYLVRLSHGSTQYVRRITVLD
jgi:phage protein U